MQLDNWTPKALGAVRIMASLLYIEHGTQKLFGFPTPAHSLSPLFSFMGLAGGLELVGGVLLLLGLRTRIVAFILSGEMAVAYFMAHASRSFFPVLNGGDAAILYCFIFLLFVFAGGGSWTIDGILGSNRAGPKREVSA
jgi:putative oxidoreductase